MGHYSVTPRLGFKWHAIKLKLIDVLIMAAVAGFLISASNVRADEPSTIITASAYFPFCCGQPTSHTAFGGSPLSAMSAACSSADGGGAEQTENLQCLIQPDGNRYRCTDNSLCAGYSIRDCAATESDHCNALPRKNNGCGEPDQLEGNPCNAATGNKVQTFKVFDIGGLHLTLTYNSQDYANRSRVGKRWTSNFHKYIYYNGGKAHLIRGDGSGDQWTQSGDSWSGSDDARENLVSSDVNLVTFYADSANDIDLIVNNPDGSADIYGDIEHNGRLYQEINPQGQVITYHYDGPGSRLSGVSNQYGQSIEITMNGAGSGGASNKVEHVTDPLGNRYTLLYDVHENLSAIVYPDQTPVDFSDNPQTTFHYENLDFPNHLTGITDANGDRYATFAYDADGKAILTEHAQTTNSVGQEQFQLNYQAGE